MTRLQEAKGIVEHLLAANLAKCKGAYEAEKKKFKRGKYQAAHTILESLGLEDYGFEKQHNKISISPFIYIHKGYKVVVKLPFIASCDKQPPRARVPYEEVDVQKLTRCKCRKSIMIQPLVDISRQYTALKELEKHYSGSNRDIHQWNTGHYKGSIY